MQCLAITSAFLMAITSFGVYAEEYGTAADAEAMVKKANEHISSAGVESAYK